MAFVKRDGARLHYEVHDYTDPWKKAQTLILQHGYGRSGKFWFNLIPYLSRHYKVVCPDLRGLGQSTVDDPATISIDNYVSDVLAIADHLGLESFHYAGESLGGIIGYPLSAGNKNRVRTLTLFSAPLFLPEHTKKTFAFGRASWAAALEELGSQAWAASVNTASRFPPDSPQGLLDWYAAEMGKSNVKVLIRMSQVASAADARGYLSKIEVPVLCFYPEAGSIATSEQEEVLRSSIKNLKVVRFPSTYHMGNMMFPAATANCTLSFMCINDGVLCTD